MKIRKAIIPAAGLGTRFLPATKSQPKEMLPIVDKPTIQYIVEEAVASGIEDIIVVTGRGKRAIEDHFDKSYELEESLEKKKNLELLKEVQAISNMVNIHYIRQKEPLGLGHAIYCASRFIGEEPFAVLLGDDIVKSETPCLKQLIEVYEKYGDSVIGVQTVSEKDVSKYGIINPGESLEKMIVKVIDLKEKPTIDEAPSRLAIMGRYILKPDIFKILERQQPGSGDEIQLTDAISQLGEVVAYHFDGTRYDVGDKLGFIKAQINFALDREDLADEVLRFMKEEIEHFNIERKEYIK